MIDEQPRSLPSPYLLDDPPSSVGRVFLARAFEHYCVLHWGLSGGEIAAAFRDEAVDDVARRVRMAARLVGEALARGAVRAWARPIGGRQPTELRPDVWELDRFDRRFATSAINPKRAFDGDAAPTDWLFVDVEDWNALIEASVADDVRRHRPRTFRLGPGAPVEVGVDALARRPADRAGRIDADRLVRLPEVKRLTGMSRSTIYRRMDQGRFPQTVPQSGNIAAWREAEVAEWLADPN